jgi:peptide/nickel transport system permease protein
MQIEVKIKKEEEQLQIQEEGGFFKNIFSLITKNIKFILLPGSKIESLTLKEEEYKRTTSQRKFLRRLKSPLTILGIFIIIFVITVAVFPQWLAPHPLSRATGFFLPLYAPPSPGFPLGTGEYGRDVLTRIIYGARVSLTVALPAIVISVVGGLIFGIIAAYYGGYIDSIIMRIADVVLAFPSLVLVLVIIANFGRDLTTILFVYGFLGIPYYSRLIRGNVLQAKELPYVDAAKVAGASNRRIMFKHIFPNVIQPIIISVTFSIGGVILGLAGLSFLGFTEPGIVEWGRDISLARLYLSKNPWATIGPAAMILITVLGFMLLGDGLRDALDPKLKNL